MLLFLHQRAAKEDGRKLSLFVHARGVVGMSYSQLPIWVLFTPWRGWFLHKAPTSKGQFLKWQRKECFLVSEFGILLYMPVCFIFKDFQFIFYSQPGLNTGDRYFSSDTVSVPFNQQKLPLFFSHHGLSSAYAFVHAPFCLSWLSATPWLVFYTTYCP